MSVFAVLRSEPRVLHTLSKSLPLNGIIASQICHFFSCIALTLFICFLSSYYAWQCSTGWPQTHDVLLKWYNYRHTPPYMPAYLTFSSSSQSGDAAFCWTPYTQHDKFTGHEREMIRKESLKGSWGWGDGFEGPNSVPSTYIRWPQKFNKMGGRSQRI